MTAAGEQANAGDTDVRNSNKNNEVEAAGETGAEKQPEVILLSDYLQSVETEIRAGIYQRVTAQVNDGSIVGLIHLAGYVMIEMRNTDRVDSSAPRKVREVLLQNDEAMIDALTVIEAEVRLEIRKQMASRLDIDTVRELAKGGNFAAIAEMAREKTQKAKRRRDLEKSRTKGKVKPKPKRA